MRFKLLLVLGLLLVYPAVAQAQTEYLLPQVAEGTFSDGSFRMTFVLVNNNDASASVTLTLSNDDGSPLQVTIPGFGTQSRFAVTLDAGATQILQTDGTGSLRAGAARVSSNRSIAVSAIFSVYDTAGKFLTEAGVGDSPPGTEFIIPVDTTGNFNTGAAFFNGGTATANLTIRLIDASGQQTQTTTDTLRPGEHRARFIGGPGQLFPSALNLRGTVVVTSSSPIAAVVLRQNSSPLSYTSLPAVPRSGGKTSFNLSHVANGTFSDGSFRTTFPIFNVSTSTAQVTLSLTDDNGNPFTATIAGRGTASTFNLSLAAGASVVLETDGAGSLASGAARITSTAPIGASAIFSVFDTQAKFLTEAGVGDATALSNLTLPVDIDSNADTGIAFFNPTTGTVTLTLRLVDSAGFTLATTTLTLPGRGHKAQFATQLFPGRTSFRGSIAVTATGGTVSAITLRQNTSPLTYTTLPVTSGVTRNAPPPSLPLIKKVVTGLSVTSNTTLDQTLDGGFKISGNINLYGTITARASDGTRYNGIVGILAPQRYVIVVPAGTYDISVCVFTAGLSMTYNDPASVRVTSDTTHDINIPVPATFGVSGTVSNLPAALLAGSLSIVFNNSDTTTAGTFPLGAGGAYQAALPSGTWTASLSSLALLGGARIQYLAQYKLGTVTVGSSATTANFTALPTATLTGAVRVPSITTFSSPPTVSASDESAFPVIDLDNLPSCGLPAFGSTVSTSDAGTYELVLASGRTYTTIAIVSLVSGGVAAGNLVFPINPLHKTVTGNTTQDFNYPALPPFVTLSGRVTGANGQAAPRVQVNVVSKQITGAADTQYTAVTTADVNGNYRLTVLSGTAYEITFSPQIPLP